jgi:hypothetical protein
MQNEFTIRNKTCIEYNTNSSRSRVDGVNIAN